MKRIFILFGFLFAFGNIYSQGTKIKLAQLQPCPSGGDCVIITGPNGVQQYRPVTDICTACLDIDTDTYLSDVQLGTATWVFYVSNKDGNLVNTISVPAPPDSDDQVLSIADNNNGTVNITIEDGNSVPLDICSIVEQHCDVDQQQISSTDNGDGSVTISLTGDIPSSTIVDVCSVVAANCNATMSYNPTTNTITYTDNAGTTTNIPLVDVLTSVSFDMSFGDWSFTYVDELGNSTIQNLCDIVDDCETVTNIAYNASTHTITYVDEDGNTTTLALDSPLTTLSFNPNGTSIDYLDENGNTTNLDLCNIVDNCETLTSITFNSTTNQLTYIDENNNSQTIDLGPLASVVQDLNDGVVIATHTSGDGTTTQIEESVTSIVNNGNNTYTFTNEAGQTTIIDVNEVDMDISNVTVAGSVLTFTAEDGTNVVADVCAIVAANCNSPMTLNADGSITYVDNAGNITNIPAPSTSTVTNTLPTGNMIGVHNDGQGTIVTINETITTFTDNGNGSITYTSENGTVTTWNETTTNIVLNPNNTSFDYTNEDGVIQNIDLCNIVDNCETVTTITYNQSNSTLTYIDEDGQATNIIVEGVLTTIALNPNGTSIDYVDEEGNTTNLDLCTIVDNCETVTSLNYNAATSILTYIDEDGNTNTIDLSVLVSSAQDLNDGNIIATHTAGDGTVTNIEETVTVMAFSAATGELTYTDENGNTTTLGLNPVSSTAQDLNDGSIIATHTAADGTVTNIEETITTLNLNGNNTSIDYTTEDGTITNLDLCTIVDNCETVTQLAFNTTTGELTYTDENNTPTVLDLSSLISSVVDLNDGNVIATHTSGDGTVTNIEETITSIVNNGDHTYTFTSENGTQTIIDVNEVDMDISNVTVAGSVLTFTAEDGTNVVADVCAIVAANCNSPMTLNPDGSITYTDNAGTTTNIPAPTVSTVTNTIAGNQIATHTSGDGTVVNINESVSTLVDNGGSFTYTDETGTVTMWNETTTSIALNPNNTSIDYTDEDGNTTNLDLCTIVQDCESLTSINFNPTTQTLSYTDEQGNITDIVLGHTTVTSNDASVTVTPSTNADGSTNYDLSVVYPDASVNQFPLLNGVDTIGWVTEYIEDATVLSTDTIWITIPDPTIYDQTLTITELTDTSRLVCDSLFLNGAFHTVACDTLFLPCVDQTIVCPLSWVGDYDSDGFVDSMICDYLVEIDCVTGDTTFLGAPKNCVQFCIDRDTDGDGITDRLDSAINDPCVPVQSAGYTGYDATNAIWLAGDCNNDGILNSDELVNGTDPYGVAASCTDGIQNGDETGVDCGGDCVSCPICFECTTPENPVSTGSCGDDTLEWNGIGLPTANPNLKTINLVHHYTNAMSPDITLCMDVAGSNATFETVNGWTLIGTQYCFTQSIVDGCSNVTFIPRIENCSSGQVYTIPITATIVDASSGISQTISSAFTYVCP